MQHLDIGDSVVYLLLPKDVPTNPTREWHGIVINIHDGHVHVVVQDEGYEGLDEWIEPRQIVSIDSKTA